MRQESFHRKRDAPLSIVFWYQKLSETPKEPPHETFLEVKKKYVNIVEHHSMAHQKFAPEK